MELQIVEKCRSVKSDAVWVQWLGYPKSRNCWRSASSHFPQLKGDDASLVLAARRRVQTTITAMAEEELEPELEGSGLVLIQGRQPINAREIRVKPVAAQSIPNGPRSRSGSTLRPRCTRHRRGRNPKNSRRAPEWQL